MKNVTISMDEKLYAEVRVEAARAGKSMSRYISQVLEGGLPSGGTDEAERKRNLEALERFLSGPKLHISEGGRMPTAEERNARR